MLRQFVFLLCWLSLPAFAQIQYLNLYTWDDYIDPQVLDTFESRFEIKVIVTTYTDDLDRDQVAAASGGDGLDLILLDDSSIQSYIRNKWIDELDEKKIPNRHYLDWDKVPLESTEKKYVQPYAEGSYGLFYREDLTQSPIDSWGALFDPPPEFRGKVGLAGQPTELLPTALLYLGFDLISPATIKMNVVENMLMSLRPQVVLFSSNTEELAEVFVDGSLAITAGYSSDLESLQRANDNIRYMVPKEGGFYWLDSLAIANNSRSKDAAYKFLNFLLEPEIAARQMVFINGLISHPQAIELLPTALRNELQSTRKKARSLHRFEDPNIWALRHMMSIWYSLDVDGVRK